MVKNTQLIKTPTERSLMVSVGLTFVFGFIALVLGLIIGPHLYGTPIHDRRSIGLVMRSPNELLRAVRAAMVIGVKPWGMTASCHLIRVFFPGGLIMNCPRSADREHVGNPAAFIVQVTSHSPIEAAMACEQRILTDLGQTLTGSGATKIHSDLDPDLPRDSIALIQAGGLPFLFGYRRHALKMGKKPKKFQMNDLERACGSLD